MSVSFYFVNAIHFDYEVNIFHLASLILNVTYTYLIPVVRHFTAKEQILKVLTSMYMHIDVIMFFS